MQWTNQNSKQTHATGVKRGKTRASKSRLVWVLLLIGRESGARFFNQSQSEVKQNQTKTRINFDTQLKTALIPGTEKKMALVAKDESLSNHIRLSVTQSVNHSLGK